MFKKLGLLAISAISAFAMHNIELNINDKDLEFSVKLDMGQFVDTTEPDTVFIGAKYLNGSYKHSDFNKDDKMYDYGEINFLMKREVANTGLSIGLGLKVNYTENFITFPLGVEASYRIPVDIGIPMFVNALVYYAPEVLSVHDARNFLEYRTEFDAEVIQHGHVVAGYRNLDTNYLHGFGGDINYNHSPYIGFRFAF